MDKREGIMNIPRVGDKVSIWGEGEVVGVQKKSWGISVEVIKRNEHDADFHCFVPLSALEPQDPLMSRKPFRQTLADILAEEHEEVEE